MVTGDLGTISGLAPIIPSSNIGQKMFSYLDKQRLTCVSLYTVFMHELRSSGVCSAGSNILK